MEHRFVEFLPSRLEEDVLYVSLEYKTVAHLCCCGCKEEVVTPITPTDWIFTYNGKGISLNPSIGNWGFKCRSHYWIKENQVVWAGDWTEQQIKDTQKMDLLNKESYYKKRKARKANSENEFNIQVSTRSFLTILQSLFKRLF